MQAQAPNNDTFDSCEGNGAYGTYIALLVVQTLGAGIFCGACGVLMWVSAFSLTPCLICAVCIGTLLPLHIISYVDAIKPPGSFAFLVAIICLTWAVDAVLLPVNFAKVQNYMNRNEAQGAQP